MPKSPLRKGSKSGVVAVPAVGIPFAHFDCMKENL